MGERRSEVVSWRNLMETGYLPCPRCGGDRHPAAVCEQCGFAVAEVWRTSLLGLLEATELERSCQALSKESTSEYVTARLLGAQAHRRSLERHLWRMLLAALDWESAEALRKASDEPA